MIGVTVAVEGTTNGVITDIDGRFQSEGPAPDTLDETLPFLTMHFNAFWFKIKGRDWTF